MLTCNCTLPYTNPDACKACPRFNEANKEHNDNNFIPDIFPQFPPFVDNKKVMKKITRTIEKYGKEGEYLGKEIITEIVEDIEVYSNISYTTDTTLK